MIEAMGIECFVKVNELEEMAQRRKSAFPDMISVMHEHRIQHQSKTSTPRCPITLATYLGNLSASRTTVSIPSRAKAAAAYEPAGPPPITNTVQLSGIAMMGRMAR